MLNEVQGSFSCQWASFDTLCYQDITRNVYKQSKDTYQAKVHDALNGTKVIM
jgi:hypothetical protein